MRLSTDLPAGYPAAAIRLFCERMGVSKSENNIDMSVLEDCVRDTLGNTHRNTVIAMHAHTFTFKHAQISMHRHAHTHTRMHACMHRLKATNLPSCLSVSR